MILFHIIPTQKGHCLTATISILQDTEICLNCFAMLNIKYFHSIADHDHVPGSYHLGIKFFV